MPKRQMLSICQKEGYSVAELTDIQNELRWFHGEAAETAGTCLSLRGNISSVENKRGLTPLKNINFLNGVLFADIMVFGADAFLLHVTTTPSVAYVVRDLSDYQILRWDARGAGLFQRKYV